MEIRHLRYFIAVAETQNFSHAADKLKIAQPPLSQQIQALEKELGVQLFDRKKRPLRLTFSGQTFLEEARQVLVQLERAIRVTKLVHQGESGHLAIGFTSSIANSIFPDIRRAFREGYPNANLLWNELATASQLHALRENRLDAGLLHLPHEALQDNDLNSELIMEEPFVAVLPARHRLATEAQISLCDLAVEDFVLPSVEFSTGLSQQIYLLCNQAGFVPNVVQEGTFMLTILGLVAGEVGVSLLPANAQNLQRRGVVYRPLQGPTSNVKIFVVHRLNDTSMLLHNFLKVVKAVAKQPV
jgi:DNA-binding transcriptional LysR family regulator